MARNLLFNGSSYTADDSGTIYDASGNKTTYRLGSDDYIFDGDETNTQFKANADGSVIGPADMTANQPAGLLNVPADAGPATLAAPDYYTPEVITGTNTYDANLIDTKDVGKYEANLIDTKDVGKYEASTYSGFNPVAVSTYQATTQEVDPTKTSSALLDNILAENSTFMRRAATQGQQFANSRGLLNTSMGAEAAQGAMIDRAAPLATNDSRIYAYQSLNNQNALNRAGEFNAGATNEVNLSNERMRTDIGTFNVGQVNQAGMWNAGQENEALFRNAEISNQAGMWNAGQENEALFRNADAANQAGMWNAGQLNEDARRNAELKDGANRFNATLQLDVSKFNSEELNQYGIAQMQRDLETRIAELDAGAKVQAATVAAIGPVMQQAIDAIAAIRNNPDGEYTKDARDQHIRDIQDQTMINVDFMFSAFGVDLPTGNGGNETAPAGGGGVPDAGGAETGGSGLLNVDAAPAGGGGGSSYSDYVNAQRDEQAEQASSNLTEPLVRDTSGKSANAKILSGDFSDQGLVTEQRVRQGRGLSGYNPRPISGFFIDGNYAGDYANFVSEGKTPVTPAILGQANSQEAAGMSRDEWLNSYASKMWRYQNPDTVAAVGAQRVTDTDLSEVERWVFNNEFVKVAQAIEQARADEEEYRRNGR